MRDAVERGWTERTVEVNREKLLETLRENKDKHIREYGEAVRGYKTLAQEKLAALLCVAFRCLADNFDLIKTKIERLNPEDESIRDTVTLLNAMTFSLEVPKDHSKSYEIAIQMAEWEVNETIELTQSQFQCFVLDDWEWTVKFKHLNTVYTTPN
tara:strand:+ start:22 stop:486 length:465 start_codon:yes stop_codon:yes gene_type:complete